MDDCIHMVDVRSNGALSFDGRRKRSFGIACYMQPMFPNRMSRRRGTCNAGPLFFPPSSPVLLLSDSLYHARTASIPRFIYSLSYILPICRTLDCLLLVRARTVCETYGSLVLCNQLCTLSSTPLLYLSRFHTTSIMSVYSTDRARCL